MDDLAKARRKWKRAEEAVEEAQARLTGAGGRQGAARAVPQARRELQEAEDEERKAKRKYRKLKSANGD